MYVDHHVGADRYGIHDNRVLCAPDYGMISLMKKLSIGTRKKIQGIWKKVHHVLALGKLI